ncbi:MAG: hypothetical protein ACKPKO_30695 [Candidatus Fonsibacter sp.]
MEGQLNMTLPEGIVDLHGWKAKVDIKYLHIQHSGRTMSEICIKVQQSHKYVV